jgi:hypothetical protein
MYLPKEARGKLLSYHIYDFTGRKGYLVTSVTQPEWCPSTIERDSTHSTNTSFTQVI